MAQTGRKPKHAALRVVEGSTNVTRHGPEEKAREIVEKAAATFGDIQCPPHLFGSGLQAWERYIKPAWWLDASREVTAIAFCDLWHEYCKDRARFAAAKHQQLRSYMAELGLTDERNRFGIGRDKTGDPFFDD